MNDPKDPKNLPPDDFSKTTPYIRAPKEDSSSSSSSSARDDYTSDWEKTNYNFSVPQTSRPPTRAEEDDWGKTAVNINVPRGNDNQRGEQQDDFGKTFMPGQMSPSSSPPQSSGWDITHANINIGGGSGSNSSSRNEDFGGSTPQNDFGATTPYIRLPESERAKYQNTNQPQQQTESQQRQSRQQTEEKPVEKKKATPAWVWFGGVALLFFLLAVTIVGAYFIFSKKYGYDVLVKGAQPQSEVLVDGTRWGYTSGTGDILLSGLSAGTHKIEIRHPNFTYENEQTSAEDGAKTVEVIAKSRQKQIVQPPKDDCANIKKGDFAKSEKCANDALDKLGDDFTVDELLRAMNLYIINFASGKYDIPANNLKFLEKSAGYMKKLPLNVVIEVGGHTDNVGKDDKNQKLSENRANAVKDALVKFGVRADILQMKGYGAAKPKSSNDTEDGKFQNRRIEYTALSK